MKIVLFEPQIPQNTGNIVRTCSITGFELFLVRPLGFRISSSQTKRAGLDYWDEVNIQYISDFENFLQTAEYPCYFFSTKSNVPYTSAPLNEEAYLIFGSESHGLPEAIHKKYTEQFYTIPMRAQRRSLNLANSVAIVSYESLRQQDFSPLASTH